MRFQNNTIANISQNLNTQINPQNIYNRNDTNMANLNTLVQTAKENFQNKNDLRNTYNARQPGNLRGEVDVQNNVNKTEFLDGDKHGNNDISGHHNMHGKKKKKCSIL
jgi:hypothetical protein